MLKAQSPLKLLGIYKALQASATQFNSLIFRVVIGFLVNVPLEIIAVVPAIEFCLNFLLEIPTGVLSDRYGRVKLALVGNLCVIVGQIFCYLGVLLYASGPDFSVLFFVLQGVFIGFYKPLTSGSVDAFYQSILLKYSEDQKDINHSINLSSKYGKYYTLASLVLGFFLIFIMMKFNVLHHIFIVGIILWILVGFRLYSDYKNLAVQDCFVHESISLDKIFKDKRSALYWAISNNILFFIYAILAGYLVASIGRFVESNKWELIAIFVLFFQGVGNLFKGIVTPYLIRNVKEQRISSWMSILLILTGLILDFSFQNLQEYSFVLFGFGSLLSFFALNTLLSLSINKIMSYSYNQYHASSISICSIGGYVLLSLFSFVLSYFYGGVVNPVSLLKFYTYSSTLYFIYSMFFKKMIREF